MAAGPRKSLRTIHKRMNRASWSDKPVMWWARRSTSPRHPQSWGINAFLFLASPR